MTVSADDGRPWESKALFRANDVDNPLPVVAETEICETKVPDIVFKGNALQTGVFLLDKVSNILEILSSRCRNILRFH